MNHGTQQSSGELQLYSLDCAALCDVLEACERLSARLSEGERQRFERIKTARGDEDARLWRAAHIALRIALERAMGTESRGMAFAAGAGGRPVLPGSGRPQFSLAHAGRVALIGISSHQAIGVDVEVNRDVNIAAARRKRIEDAASALVSDGSLPAAGDARFLQAWVRLEAAAKATGLGIGRILTRAGALGGGDAEADFDIGGLVTVRDVDAGAGRFAAVAARDLPAGMLVQQFPATQEAVAAFLGR